MEKLFDFISQPWPWYIGGPAIAFIMFLLLWFGKSFGISSNFRTLCSISGGAKFSDYFDFDWKNQIWNLVFLTGSIVGGFIGHYFLSNNIGASISNETIIELQNYGLTNVGAELIPTEIFNFEMLFSVKGFIMMVVGGFLVGFGTRYASGCTSGHAIAGLSNLQLPSLIAVIGFFIGGLIATYFILPYVLVL
jgi:uncharacterized membrane protein YedE/YeeE